MDLRYDSLKLYRPAGSKIFDAMLLSKKKGEISDENREILEDFPAYFFYY